MMPHVLVFGAMIVGALIQLFFPAWAWFGGVKPPVLLALMLYYALRRSSQGMWVVLIGAAILQDGLDLGGFGPALIGFPLVGVVVHRIRKHVFIDGLVAQIVLGALGSMMVMWVAALFYRITGVRPVSVGYAFLRILGAGILGMIVFPLVSIVMNYLTILLPKRREYGW